MSFLMWTWGKQALAAAASAGQHNSVLAATNLHALWEAATGVLQRVPEARD